ncbi:glycosyltransferase [Patescibacteria group bacterium]|nr:glycosyltransferase [Patescibacteria group bacterium]
MNIGFFTDSYTPLVDGVVRSIILYRQELEKRGHKVYIFAPKKIKSRSDFVNRVKVKDDKRVFRFQAVDSVVIPGYPLAIPISFKATKKIPALNLDIVHCQTPATMGLLGDMVSLLENIPKVYTYHTYYPEYAGNYIFSGKFKTKEAVQKYDVLYCNRSDRVIVPSPKLENILSNWGVKAPVSVLPTGIDLAEFSAADGQRFRKKQKIASDQKILLFVGRLGIEKNVDFLVEVVAKLRAQQEKVILVIVGDGKDRKDLEKKAKGLGLEDDVIFTGFLSRQDTLDAFAAAHVFVFSSKTDTQGLVLAEAAVLGKPIIMVEDKGLGSIVINGENGFVVPEDVDIFAEKVKIILHDKELYVIMSAKSKGKAWGLSIANQTSRLLQIYNETLADHRDFSWRIKFWSGLRKEVKVPRWIKDKKDLAVKYFKKQKKLFNWFR